MTVASAFVPKPSDQRMPETRPQEPSMEDILASIRRIIADDQMQSSRPGYGGPRRVASLGAGAPPAEPETATKTDRSLERARSGYDDVLDLARTPQSGEAAVTASSSGGRRPFSDEASSSPEPQPFHEIPVAEEAEATHAEEADQSPDEPVTASGNGHVSAAETDSSYSESHLSASEPDDPPGQPNWTNDTHQRPEPASELPAPVGDALLSPALGASVMSAFETLAATVVLQNTEMLERVMRELLRPLIKTWLDENLPTLVERLVRNEIERVARGGRG